jgi:hypothetical protein
VGPGTHRWGSVFSAISAGKLQALRFIGQSLVLWRDSLLERSIDIRCTVQCTSWGSSSYVGVSRKLLWWRHRCSLGIERVGNVRRWKPLPDSKLRGLSEFYTVKLRKALKQYWDYGRGNPLCWPHNTLYPQKLALTSSTSGGRLVGIVSIQGSLPLPRIESRILDIQLVAQSLYRPIWRSNSFGQFDCPF